MRGLCPHRGMLTYGVQYDRRILRKIPVSKSQDRIARDTQTLIPHSVSRLVQIMHAAVQLYDQSDLMTGEVGDGARNRRLPPELQSIQLSVTQHGPKDRLRARHVGAKAA